jgi:hypothetical protein
MRRHGFSVRKLNLALGLALGLPLIGSSALTQPPPRRIGTRHVLPP